MSGSFFLFFHARLNVFLALRLLPPAFIPRKDPTIAFLHKTTKPAVAECSDMFADGLGTLSRTTARPTCGEMPMVRPPQDRESRRSDRRVRSRAYSQSGGCPRLPGQAPAP